MCPIKFLIMPITIMIVVGQSIVSLVRHLNHSAFEGIIEIGLVLTVCTCIFNFVIRSNMAGQMIVLLLDISCRKPPMPEPCVLLRTIYSICRCCSAQCSFVIVVHVHRFCIRSLPRKSTSLSLANPLPSSPSNTVQYWQYCM